MKRFVVIAIAFAVGTSLFAFGQGMKTAQDHGFFNLSDIKWVDGPASLPSGAKMAILEGNLAEAGPFTLRFLVPDGYVIPPHSHPAVEHVTVISGTLNLGMGEKFDKSAGRALTAGSFAFMPAGMRHFAWATGETVLQIHGIGPWRINYVNPADDPRHKK